jgi:hypothetical protein
VIAKRIPTGDGFEVVEVDENHSCLEEDGTIVPFGRIDRTESKIKQLKPEVELGERKRMYKIREDEDLEARITATESEEERREPRARHTSVIYSQASKRRYAVSSLGEEEEDSNSNDSSEEEIVDPRSRRQLSRISSHHSTSSQSKFSRKKSTVQEENELRFPRAIDVQDEIDQLLSVSTIYLALSPRVN